MEVGTARRNSDGRESEIGTRDTPWNSSFHVSFGHFAYGSRDITVDGKVIKGDPRRGKGTHFNPVMRVDPVLKNVGLQHVTGGSICFYDTRVKVVKA